MDPLSEDNEADHLEKDYSDSAEYLPELDEEVPNEVELLRLILANTQQWYS